MKIEKLLFNAFWAINLILAVSCSDTINQLEDTLSTKNDEKSSEIAFAPGDSCTFSGDLLDEEITSLMKMREEEKLARDVYKYFYETYNYSVFINISQSEDIHANAVLNLINGYGLEDPTLPEEGVFSAEAFTTLYSSLTNDGSENLIAALRVGAFIEELDINDLQELLNGTIQNADIIRVYSNLLQGSESHLRAFSNVLKQFGEVYEPQIISAEEYDAILAGSNSKGNGNKAGSRNSSYPGTGNQYGKNQSSKGN